MVVLVDRKLLAKGEINYELFMNMVSASLHIAGHFNTIRTASPMNPVPEVLWMSLTGCAVIAAA